MSFLSQIFGRRSGQNRLAPLYAAVVAVARDPAWYRDGAVPDTIDGRFDMVAAVLALVLIRLEAEGERARADSVLLTERFIADMDGNLRQLGAGDVTVGKQVGKLMGALGGRVGAFRAALDGDGDFAQAVSRNIFHDSPSSAEATSFVATRLKAFHDRLVAAPADQLLAGALP